ncbi:MAG: hypothetical protein IPM82_11905 [Saprospiraceae bacterium]|nr:hypothetical protein [Saprospiraceae bacterium]
MERYRTPVSPPMEAMRNASENSNSNIKGGILTSQAAIIEGIALFILDRAKDEVIINFLDRLVNDETPDFKKLFPNVVTEFAGTDFGFSNAFLGRLRQAFYEDIQTLSVRLPLLMLDDDYFAELQAEPIAYNLLVLYSMASLTQSGLSVEEAVPVTNRYLYEASWKGQKR